MTTVYVLQHESSSEDVKLIGVYASEAEACEAIERARSLPGFVDDQDGFSVDAYTLGQDHWTAGFVSGRGTGARLRSKAQDSRAA